MTGSHRKHESTDARLIVLGRKGIPLDVAIAAGLNSVCNAHLDNLFYSRNPQVEMSLQKCNLKRLN
jgi:hypothetical protein